MIKVYNTTTKQYLPYTDYINSLVDTTLPYGESRVISAVGPGPDPDPETGESLAKFTCTGHGYLNGQYVYISGTTNYDGRYAVIFIDADHFLCVGLLYVDSETGTTYPDMDYVFYIAFLYTVESLFTEVKLKSAVQAKTLKDGNGNLMMDEVAMTEDRRDIFLLFLQDAADKIFKVIHAYSKGIVNSYKFNQQIDIDGDLLIGSTELDYYVHFVINNELANQDENMYPLLDIAIKDALVAYVLKEWYLTTPFAANAQIFEARSNALMAEVNSLIMSSEGHKRVVFNESPV